MPQLSRNSILGAILEAILALAVLWLNPFQNLTKYVGENLYMRSIAAYYPPNRPQTLLVLADDKTLGAAADGQLPNTWQTWPLPLSVWSSALDEAQARGVKLAFLDIALIDRRNARQEHDLLRTIQLVSKTTDILLADPGQVGRGETLAAWLVRNAASNRVRLVSPERAPTSGFSTTYLVNSAHKKSPIAAMEMARIYCSKPTVKCAQGTPIDKTFEVWWPLPICSLTHQNSAPCSSAFIGPIIQGGKILASQALSGFCENFPKTSGCGLLLPGTVRGYAVPKLALEEFLADRDAIPPGSTPAVVVFGQDFEMAQDLAQSPVFGMTPGAHVQAVAFDNIATLGKRVITRHFPWEMSENQFLSLWIIAIISFSHLARSMLRASTKYSARLKLNHKWWPSAKWWDKHVSAIILFGALILFFFFCFQNCISPANWVAAYGALGIISSREHRVERHARKILAQVIGVVGRHTVAARVLVGTSRRR